MRALFPDLARTANAAGLGLAILFSNHLSAPALAADLVMVEEPGCIWCAQWERDLGEIYPKTPEGAFAPLTKIGLRATRQQELGFTLVRPVSFTPTFLLVENGAELARIEGYPGEDFFWGLLDKMLVENTNYIRPES